MTIKNINDLCIHMGVKDSGELAHDLYKYTECGAGIDIQEDGVSVGSIVEGSDSEFYNKFCYPFESEELDNWIDELEVLCDEAWHEANDEDEDEVTLEISHVGIKSETFCAPWNGQLYCVDICEDAEERSAWIYNVNNSVKSLMFGEKITQQSREEFLDCVFSSLPSHIEYYVEEYED